MIRELSEKEKEFIFNNFVDYLKEIKTKPEKTEAMTKAFEEVLKADTVSEVVKKIKEGKYPRYFSDSLSDSLEEIYEGDIRRN